MAIVSKKFWLEFAGNHITNSIESRDKAAAKLDDFLKWLWGIYTSVFALASIFDYISNNIYQIILVVQPVLIIIIARFFCTIVSIPGSIKADPNKADKIQEAHKEIIKRKIRRLQNAIIATIFSIISLSVALVGYNRLDPNRELKSEIKKLKLNKERAEQIQNPLYQRVDSLKKVNEYYEFQLKSLLNKQKLECLQEKNKKCLDSLNAIKIQ